MILVTGSTGAIGSEVVRLLSRAGAPARALIRNPTQRQELSGVTWVTGDLGKRETLLPAPAWVDSLLAIAAYQRAGGPTETMTTVVSDLTGKPPRTFAEFARDYADAFRRDK